MTFFAEGFFDVNSLWFRATQNGGDCWGWQSVASEIVRFRADRMKAEYKIAHHLTLPLHMRVLIHKLNQLLEYPVRDVIGRDHRNGGLGQAEGSTFERVLKLLQLELSWAIVALC
jgi:hypothetical protein